MNMEADHVIRNNNITWLTGHSGSVDMALGLSQDNPIGIPPFICVNIRDLIQKGGGTYLAGLRLPR